MQKGQLIATLEIPELQSQLRQDDAAIKNASEQITHAQNELGRVEAQHKVMQLQFDRLNNVAKSKPGLVAQQEVDDSEGESLGVGRASGRLASRICNQPKARWRCHKPSGSTIRICSTIPKLPRLSPE